MDPKRFDDALYLINGMLKARARQPGPSPSQGLQPVRPQEKRGGPARIPTGHAGVAFYQDRSGPHRLHPAGAGQGPRRPIEQLQAMAREEPGKRRDQVSTSHRFTKRPGAMTEAERPSPAGARQRTPDNSRVSFSDWASYTTSRRTRNASHRGHAQGDRPGSPKRQRPQLPRVHLRRSRPEPG
ncbi:MAG: hypothetical protein MZV70_35490 [Desulfobacterales bacterium]|nr:hypothetical protein [Desulfobacterales bacterium]